MLELRCSKLIEHPISLLRQPITPCTNSKPQAAQLASQAQQAVQTAQQSEAQARQLIEQTRQEAIGHVENARQVVNATQQDAQQEVQRIVLEAQQAISQREQTIASQEHTIRGLSQENSVMHQPLREAPFGAPPTPSAVKSKSVYITVERIIKFKETPGCRACTGHSKIHSAECKNRFSELVSADRAEAAAKSAANSESKEPIPIVHTEGDEELARAIHASEHDKDPKIAVSAEDVAHEFDAAEAGNQLPQDPVPYFSIPRQRQPLHRKVKIFGCSKKMPTVWFGTISCQGRIFLPQRRSRIAPFPQKGSLQLAPLVPCFRGAKQTTSTMVGLVADLIA